MPPKNHKTSSSPPKISVAFCCLGNYCRSPMAEAVFDHIVTQANLRQHFDLIDSCGTAGYHEGETPDQRTTAVLKKHGIKSTCLGRAVRQDDYYTFDYIFGMDGNNVKHLKEMAPRDGTAQILLFGQFDDKKPIYDPYYGIGGSGFDSTYEQCVRYSKVSLGMLRKSEGAEKTPD